MRIPALAQLADRAGEDGVLAVLDLGQKPAERHLGLPALASNGAGDVALLARLDVLAGERRISNDCFPRWRIDPATSATYLDRMGKSSHGWATRLRAS
ncbi:MAG: hypothetical protein ACT4OS_00345 [Acidimicrobiales bacterium]